MTFANNRCIIGSFWCLMSDGGGSHARLEREQWRHTLAEVTAITCSATRACPPARLPVCACGHPQSSVITINYCILLQSIDLWFSARCGFDWWCSVFNLRELTDKYINSRFLVCRNYRTLKLFSTILESARNFCPKKTHVSWNTSPGLV